jgi:hypothetical protein
MVLVLKISADLGDASLPSDELDSWTLSVT